jgi:hypothetical protein
MLVPGAGLPRYEAWHTDSAGADSLWSIGPDARDLRATFRARALSSQVIPIYGIAGAFDQHRLTVGAEGMLIFTRPAR